jgi:hypothetical protein
VKSSNVQPGIQGGFLSNGPLYTLLALYMPLSILIALVFLTGSFLPLPAASIIISGCISAAAASLYCDFMKDVKSSRIAANIRGGIIIMGIFYILTSLFRRELPGEGRFLPDLANSTPSLGALYAWYSVVSLKQLFSARKRFEIYTELYRGEQLQKALIEDSGLLRYTDEEIIKKRRYYFAQLIIIAIFTFVNVINKIHVSPVLYLLLTVILAGGVCIGGFFEVMRWEQYYAGEGIALSLADRLKRIGGMGIFTLLCIVCAILAASDKSLLPFSAVTGFLAWFFSLFRRLFLPFAGNYETPSFEPMELSPFLPLLEESEPGPVLKWLAEYGAMLLKYLLIILAAAGFIRFMVSPLLNRGKSAAEKLTFREKLIRIIAEWFREALTALASFYTLLKDGKKRQKSGKHTAEEIGRTAAAILGAYSPAKKRDIRRSVTLFARLIIWGGEVRQVVWKPAHAPGEYCGILAATSAEKAEMSNKNFLPRSNTEFHGEKGENHTKAPWNSKLTAGQQTSVVNSYSLDTPVPDGFLKRINEGIIRCGELFEQAIYSAEVLSAAERDEFRNLVEHITSSPV